MGVKGVPERNSIPNAAEMPRKTATTALSPSRHLDLTRSHLKNTRPAKQDIAKNTIGTDGSF